MDWDQQREIFKRAYSQTQISLSNWCKEHSIDYQVARKYIRVSDIKVECSVPLKTKRQNVKKQPQKKNTNSFKKGNMVSRKHGGYAQLLNDDDVDIARSVISLSDELIVCRSRLVSVIKARIALEIQIKEEQSIEAKSCLNEQMLKFIDAEDRTIARIESLTLTLDKLEMNQVMTEKNMTQIDIMRQTFNTRDKEIKSLDEGKVIYNIDW
ncbi:hypothetical protein N9R79_12260 [Vibrio sp.]|nr:hypothetical protein [Vibrio sp.]